MAIDANGKIVVAGWAKVNNGWRFALARYNTNGSLDTTFSSDGKLTTNFLSSKDEGANAMAIDANGKIVVAGSAGLWAQI